MKPPNIYLDYSATTPVDPSVSEVMQPYFTDIYGNASSVHAHGRKAKAALERSRELIASELGVHPGEILFTSGGTESDNSAILGAAFAMRRHGKTHIITSKAEHQAVLEPCEFLETHGFTVTRLDVGRFGAVDTDDLAKALLPETGLVSLMHVNNELGTFNDIAALGELCTGRGILFHTDAVQSFAKIPVNMSEMPVDLASLSAHKIYGPKGIGALYIRKSVEIDRFQHGGGQERGRRGGTENVALAVGFAKAVELMQRNRIEEANRLKSLRDILLLGLRSKLNDIIIINTDLNNSAGHILNISFDVSKISVDGEALLMGLDTAGLSVSNGSACTSGSLEPSHVQRAIGHSVSAAKSAIRFSLGRFTSINEINRAVDIVAAVVEKISRPAEAV
jgi:cysteine desulfurase